MVVEIPPGFIDIHSHILPGLDDGPAAMEECVAMARRYRAIGVGCVVATPHWYRFSAWSAKPEAVVRAAAELEKALAEAGEPLTILPGMEIGFTDRLGKEELAVQCLPLGGSDHYLAEFPLTMPLANPEHYILHLGEKERQARVILAHPERCAAFADNDESLQLLLDCGVLVQVNTTSLLGGFGPQIQQAALAMLRQGQVHFLATDAHGAGHRQPPDPGEWATLADYLGEEVLAVAMRDNPRRLLTGVPVLPLQVDSRRLEAYFPATHRKQDDMIADSEARDGLGARIRRWLLQ